MNNDHYLKKELYDLIRNDESVFDFIQENLLDGLWYLDLENPDEEWMSPLFWKILGYDPQEMPHKTSARNAVIFNDDLALANQKLVKCIQDIGKPFDYVARYRHKNGDTKWMRCYGKGISNKHGEVVRIIGVHQDVTDLKNAEELDECRRGDKEYAEELAALNEEYIMVNEQLRQMNTVLVEAHEKLGISEFNLNRAQSIAKLGSWYLNVETNEVQWTEELYHMYGFDPNSPPPPYTEHAKLFTPNSWKRLATSLAKTRSEGVPYELELKTVKNDGGHGWVWVRGEAVLDDNDKIIGLWGAAQDITEHKEMLEALKKAKRNAEENERHLKGILDNMFEGYQILDKNWVYKYINEAAEKHNLRPKEELLGKVYMDCWPGITQTKVFKLMKDSMEHGSYYRFENKFEYPSGKIGWFDIGIQPIRGGVFILSNDITANKKTETQLIEAKEKAESNARQLKEAQRTAKMGSWTWHILEGHLEWSDEMYHIFEIPKDGFVGELDAVVQQLIHPDDRAAVVKANESVVLHNKPYPLEYRICTKSGALKYVYAIADQIIMDENNQSVKISGIVKDITDYKMVQLQLAAAKEKAEESSRLKSAFLANMSHEIRTPMNAIVGFASFLKDRRRTREQLDRYADVIVNSGNHLLNLINDIIDIAKIDSGQMKLLKTDVDLNDLMRELYNFFHSRLVSKKIVNVRLKMEVPNQHLIISVDETRVRQIMLNLLGNAVKFTEQGVIKFGFDLVDDKVQFFVSDTGIGIPESKQLLIFERFQQAADNTERVYGGTGLGLSIAKACTQLLGGEIWLESEMDIGTTFYFAIAYEASTKEQARDKKPGQGDYRFNNELVLIAEDDDYNYDYLETILLEYDLRLQRAVTGREAISKVLEQDDVSLVLMDIQMPDLTGMEATIEIRKHKPHLPIIAQTAYAMDSDKERFLKIGCNAYISKPINETALLALLSETISANANRQE